MTQKCFLAFFRTIEQFFGATLYLISIFWPFSKNEQNRGSPAEWSFVYKSDHVFLCRIDWRLFCYSNFGSRSLFSTSGVTKTTKMTSLKNVCLLPKAVSRRILPAQTQFLLQTKWQSPSFKMSGQPSICSNPIKSSSMQYTFQHGTSLGNFAGDFFQFHNIHLLRSDFRVLRFFYKHVAYSWPFYTQVFPG